MSSAQLTYEMLLSAIEVARSTSLHKSWFYDKRTDQYRRARIQAKWDARKEKIEIRDSIKKEADSNRNNGRL